MPVENLFSGVFYPTTFSTVVYVPAGMLPDVAYYVDWAMNLQCTVQNWDDPNFKNTQEDVLWRVTR